MLRLPGAGAGLPAGAGQRWGEAPRRAAGDARRVLRQRFGLPAEALGPDRPRTAVGVSRTAATEALARHRAAGGRRTDNG
ncbi:hypothetical protein [Streptomyces sp. IMTB 1903]|uniref:hypothetical protein n=1 Tax=Streptomyces sp. IMTB 1903 TaxID=1776680 RepID=UPI000AE7DE6E|nr:hypothetical protein [Streptomyces sp. IMTB 1903]